MNYTYKNDTESFANLLGDCLEYVWESQSDSCKTTLDYMKELADVICADKKNHDKAWELLVNSGVFHDAMGEVVEYDNNSVTTTDEY